MTNPSTLCRWPECSYHATRHKGLGAGGRDLISLCTIHGKAFDRLTYSELKRIEWQPRRVGHVGG